MMVIGMYRRLAKARVDADLPALFARLGVALHGGTVDFDDSAPLAAFRRQLSQRYKATR